jgi:hypothetical protein
MKRKKHNKKRNTAFLYETLINEVTKAVVSGEKDKINKITNIITKYFNDDSVLKEEVDLYGILLDTKSLDKQTASKLLDETKRVYFSLNQQEIFDKQTEAIKDINKNLSKNVFSNFIPNYKDLATISQIFSKKTNVKQRVLLEKKIIDEMTSTNQINENTMQPIDNIVYKTFVNKFNDKYSDSLISEQKELLNKYIVSFVDNGIDLKIFMNEEITRLKNELNSSFTNNNISDDVEMVKNTKNVLNLLESFKEKQIDDNMLMRILKIQDLVKEIQSDASSS